MDESQHCRKFSATGNTSWNESPDDADRPRPTTNLVFQEIDMLALDALDFTAGNAHNDPAFYTNSAGPAVSSGSITTATSSNLTAARCGQGSQDTSKPETFLWEEDVLVGDFPGDTTTPFCVAELPCVDFDILSYTSADSQSSSDWFCPQQLDKSVKAFDGCECIASPEVPSFKSALSSSSSSSSSTVDLMPSLSSSNDFTPAAHFTKIKPRAVKNCAEQRQGRRDRDSSHNDDDDSATPIQTLLHRQPRRDVGEPKRPKNGFLRYSIKHRAELLKCYPFKDNRFISKLLGIRWKKMSAEEKQPYVEEFNHDIHEIRAHNPTWRYAPAKQCTEELIDPMHKRLRPRDKIRLKDAGRDWSFSAENSHHPICEWCQSPLEKNPTAWKQCIFCSQWCPLPGHVD